jgi:AcrR family transcriptional regulator
MDAAYELFSKDGVSQVGIDTILAKSGCAKASLYTNFKTKVELAIAFLIGERPYGPAVGWSRK